MQPYVLNISLVEVNDCRCGELLTCVVYVTVRTSQVVATDAPVILRYNGVVRVPDDEDGAIVFPQLHLAVSLDYYHPRVCDVLAQEAGFL